MKALALIVSALILVSCNHSNRKVVFTKEAPKPIGPYSQAILSNGRLYLSGQIGLKPDGALDTSSIENECRQALNNIKAVLAAGGMGMDRICKSTIYTTDLKNFSTINSVYGSYFGSEPPARETVEVKGLPKGARVEMSVIAE